MQPDEALDDLRAIRRIMERAYRASDGSWGWFLVLWGAIWVVGFLSTGWLVRAQREALIPWVWGPLNAVGVIGSIGISLWIARRTRMKSFTIWWPFMAWWFALALFDLLLIRFLPIREGPQIAMLIVLSIALGYFQMGLFTHWLLSALGAFIGALAVLTAALFPQHLGLAMVVLGGGAMIGVGLWALRYGNAR